MVLGLLVAALGTASCSSSSESSPPPGTSPAGSADPVRATTTAGVPGLSDGAAALDVKTAAILDKAAAEITLTDEQRACVGARLDADPTLRSDLGEDPATSKRWPNYAKLASECINTVSFSAEWALAVQSQSGGTLTAEQMSCLRRGMAAFSSADVDAIRQAGIEPEKADPAMGARVDALLASCSVDKGKLTK